MSGPLVFVSHEMVRFGANETWVDLKSFSIKSEASDLSLLASLIDHDQYHDHYAGQEASEQSHHSLHGPYRLEAITPEVFEPSQSRWPATR